MTAREFSELVRALLWKLDRDDLMWMSEQQHHNFCRDPAVYFATASPRAEKRIWAAIERQGVKA